MPLLRPSFSKCSVDSLNEKRSKTRRGSAPTSYLKVLTRNAPRSRGISFIHYIGALDVKY